jgi:hypothetical protein
VISGGDDTLLWILLGLGDDLASPPRGCAGFARAAVQTTLGSRRRLEPSERPRLYG